MERDVKELRVTSIAKTNTGYWRAHVEDLESAKDVKEGDWVVVFEGRPAFYMVNHINNYSKLVLENMKPYYSILLELKFPVIGMKGPAKGGKVFIGNSGEFYIGHERRYIRYNAQGLQIKYGK